MQVATLRRFEDRDVPECLSLSTASGWNQTAEDWRLLLELNPQGCLAMACDGTLAATTTLVCYGRRLGWIGMVLTRPEFRRLGFARRLLTRALAMADEQGIETVGLDATEQGRPLYEQLGFRAGAAIERWYRPDNGTRAGRLEEGGPPGDLDRRAFGADRSRLLGRLGNPLTARDGYVFHRPGTRAHYVGPCVAGTLETARSLIARVNHESGVFWDLFPAHPYSAELARALGFEPQRRLTRMTRGAGWESDTSLVYAIAGFELG
jgi:GNAT superfamily N-acetyltransferase